MTDRLNPDAIFKGLNELPGWEGTSEGIAKTYEFSSPEEASAFVQRVGTMADAMNHHPDITHEGARVVLSLVTHSAGGVTQKDLDLATQIDTGEAHGDANPENPSAGRGSDAVS